MGRRLDEIDKRILYYLAEDARNVSAPQIAEDVDVSPGTIRNRIQQLESAGVIRGYHADIDYERVENRMTNLYVCNTPVGDREGHARHVLEIPGVVNVRKLRKGRGNLQVKAVGEDMSDLTRIAQQIHALGLEIEDEDLLQEEYFRPYRPFGPEDDDGTGMLADVMQLSGEAEVADVTVAEGAQILETTLRQANERGLLDDDVLVIAIERDDEIITPKGNTAIEAGDLVSLFSRSGITDDDLAVFRTSASRRTA